LLGNPSGNLLCDAAKIASLWLEGALLLACLKG
jgi:hypothetical protein